MVVIRGRSAVYSAVYCSCGGSSSSGGGGGGCCLRLRCVCGAPMVPLPYAYCVVVACSATACGAFVDWLSAVDWLSGCLW